MKATDCIEGLRIMTKNQDGQGGFTLVELMVVVVIAGIILSIGYVSYKSQLYQGRRVSGKECLLDRAQYMERYYATYLTYSKEADPPQIDIPCTERSARNFYRIEGMAQARSYTVKAIPINAQAGDSCGTLTLESNGRKMPESCW